MMLLNPFRNHPSRSLLAGLAALAVATTAEAAVFSFDIKANNGSDSYGTGPGLLGGADSVWNSHIRFPSTVSQSLVDDTGAASSVTVDYVSSVGFGVGNGTGAFTALGVSHATTGTVTVSGLTPGLAYDLAIFSKQTGTPTWTVGSTTQGLTATDDWSTLTAGANYVLFHTTASGGGVVSFTPGADSGWSAFQIAPTAVPEPAECAAAFGLLSLGAGAWLRSRRSA